MCKCTCYPSDDAVGDEAMRTPDWKSPNGDISGLVQAHWAQIHVTSPLVAQQIEVIITVGLCQLVSVILHHSWSLQLSVSWSLHSGHITSPLVSVSCTPRPVVCSPSILRVMLRAGAHRAWGQARSFARHLVVFMIVVSRRCFVLVRVLIGTWPCPVHN